MSVAYNKLMSEAEPFVPDPCLEAGKLLVVEHALGEDGIIDRHLRWVETPDAPSSRLSDREYGFLPLRFDGETKGYRPSREPIDFQELVTNSLGLPYDEDYTGLVGRIREVETGWFDYVVSVELLDEDRALAMQEAAEVAYKLDTLTEDNLPAYVAFLLGDFKAHAEKAGVKIPVTEEWTRGIWTAEEDAHKLSMNEYGKITGITNTPEHVAGRNSQLRAGTEISLEHVIQLFAYTAWQELSTNIAHTRNGKLFGPIGNQLLDRIGADEARHHLVYQKVLQQLYLEFPEDTIRTLHSVLMKPFMPGKKGIPNFIRKSAKINGSAIFGIEQGYQAAQSVLKKLGLLDENKDVMGLSNKAVNDRAELRATYQQDAPAKRKKTAKFVLDETLTSEQLSDARKAYSSEMGLVA